MSAAFISASEVNRQQWPGMGDLGFICHSIESESVFFGDLFFSQGDGFNFHEHPNQTEILYLMSGSLEVWIDTERRTMHAGDTLYLPAGTIHAAFNVSEEEARMFVVLNPRITSEELGLEIVDHSEEAPWNTLR